MKIGKFNFTKARLNTDLDGNVELCLLVEKDYRHVARAITVRLGQKEGPYTASLSDAINDRTLRQNSMMWAICTLIADHDNGGRTGGKSPEDVYYEILRKYGVHEFLMVLEAAIPQLKTAFRGVEIIDTRKHNGKDMKVVKCTYGSSNYDTKQMGNVIDGLLDEAAKREIYNSDIEYLKQERAKDRKE